MDKILFALQQKIGEAVQQQSVAGVGPLKDIKAVYYGDPVQIPEANLPAIAIQPTDTEYTLRGSRYDQKDCSVEVRLVINKKDFYNDTGTPNNTVLAVQNMVERIETQGSLQDVLHSSICGIIQNDTCLHYVDPSDGNTKRASALAKVVGVQYRFSQDRGFPTYEGVTRIVATTIGDR